MKLVFSFLLIACFYFGQSQDTVKVGANLSTDQLAEEDYNMGLLALKDKNYQQAAELFSKSLSAKPGFDKAHANRSVAYTHLGKYNEALWDVNLAIIANPQNPENYFNKSLIYMGMQLPDSQSIALDACLNLNHDHAEAAYYKGLLSYKSGDYEKSISYYSMAISSNRNYVFAYNDRGSAKRALGDLPGAIEDYTRATLIDSSYAFIYNNLGTAARLNKSFPKAIAAFTKALALDHTYLLALNNRGVANFDHTDFKSAQSDFELALTLDSKNSFAYNNLCSIALKTKDFKKAKDLASRSIELDPNNGPAYYNRGIAKQMLREEESCCADWKKALELGVKGAKTFINASCKEH